MRYPLRRSVSERPRYERSNPRSSLKSKRPKFTPRVRQLDEDFEGEDDGATAHHRSEPYIPEPEPTRPPIGKPFLRIVKTPTDIHSVEYCRWPHL